MAGLTQGAAKIDIQTGIAPRGKNWTTLRHCDEHCTGSRYVVIGGDTWRDGKDDRPPLPLYKSESPDFQKISLPKISPRLRHLSKLFSLEVNIELYFLSASRHNVCYWLRSLSRISPKEMFRTMRKLFAVGDKIVYNREPVSPLMMAASLGATATVVPLQQYDKPQYIRVVWDRTNTLCGEQMDGCYSPERFSLHTPKEYMTKMNTPVPPKPFGMSTLDMIFMRRMLLTLVGSEAFADLSEDDVAHAARLIHRLGRVSA